MGIEAAIIAATVTSVALTAAAAGGAFTDDPPEPVSLDDDAVRQARVDELQRASLREGFLSTVLSERGGSLANPEETILGSAGLPGSR